MTQDFVDLDALPLRFNPPDGWRTPNPRFVSLYQGAEFPPDWQPYPDAPTIPPAWPWWEENGTSWYRFFRDRAPMPARSLGNWFSLAALGLFTITVSPFALPGWFAVAGGLIGLLLIILGIRGILRTLKKQNATPLDPYEAIRSWAKERRETYFRKAYQEFLAAHLTEIPAEQFTAQLVVSWWGENSEAATN
jgi:hypothetical protein